MLSADCVSYINLCGVVVFSSLSSFQGGGFVGPPPSVGYTQTLPPNVGYDQQQPPSMGAPPPMPQNPAGMTLSLNHHIYQFFSSGSVSVCVCVSD